MLHFDVCCKAIDQNFDCGCTTAQFCVWTRYHPDFPRKRDQSLPAGRVELSICHTTAGISQATGSRELFLANHLNNNENVPSLEVWPRIYSHFHQIASTRSSLVVAYLNFTVNSYDHFLSKAGLFSIKLSLTTNVKSARLQDITL